MATQNLLQRLDSAADTTGSSINASNRRIEEVFIAAEAISANDAVSLDAAQASESDKALYVMKTDTGTATDTFFVGIALESAAIGEAVRVCIRGFCEANVAGATAPQSRLQVGSVAGRLDVVPDVAEGGSATVALRPIVAISTELDTANVATVYVLPNF